MKNLPRLFIALIIFASGLALVPYVSLSSEPFSWQKYADAYQPGPVQVNIRDFAFEPGLILITAGTTVRWTNLDATPHTVTGDTGVFDSGTLQNGDSFEFTFDQPGAYDYSCSFHPAMTGRVVVVASAEDIFNVFLPIVLR